MKYCTKCGASLTGDTRFCPQCGQPAENDNDTRMMGARVPKEGESESVKQTSLCTQRRDTPRSDRKSKHTIMMVLAVVLSAAIGIFVAVVMSKKEVPEIQYVKEEVEYSPAQYLFEFTGPVSSIKYIDSEESNLGLGRGFTFEFDREGNWTNHDAFDQRNIKALKGSIFSTRYTPEGLITQWDIDKPGNHRYTRNFVWEDGKLVLLKSAVWEDTKGTVEYSFTTKQADNNPTEVTEIQRRSNKGSVRDAEYRNVIYDDRGNWIERDLYKRENGGPWEYMLHEKRRLTYY